MVAVVAEHYGVTVEQLRGPKRDREIVVPRQIAAYLSREETDASLVRIGGALGGETTPRSSTPAARSSAR